MGNQSLRSNNPKLIFACSGAADVGDIADRAARKLYVEKISVKGKELLAC